MQIQLNKLLVGLIAIVLLSAAGCAPDTPQNNGMGSNNQNAPNGNNPGQNPALRKPCSNDVGKDIREVIEKEQAFSNIKNQFKEFNQTGGTVSFSFDGASKELIFKGSITSSEKDLQVFFNRFDKFRNDDCVRKVKFQGETPDKVFVWQLTPSTTLPASCSVDIEDALESSDLKDQHNTKHFDYLFDADKVLTLSGFVNDEKGHINNLFVNLKDNLSNGCISKIVFGSQSKTGEKATVEQGFTWSICPGTQVECHGLCVDICSNVSITNSRPTNTNKNTNTNSR
jgi:hypothetical protein